jgi:hypothetical protein
MSQLSRLMFTLPMSMPIAYRPSDPVGCAKRALVGRAKHIDCALADERVLHAIATLRRLAETHR